MEKISNKLMLKSLAVAAMLLAPVLTWAQASSSLTINVTNENLKAQADGSKMIDLIAEIKKQRPSIADNIELQMVRAQAKAGIGGAQLLLKINGDYVASSVVETDPDQFAIEDARTYGNFELKNIDRSRINSAFLQLQAASRATISTVEVILGAVQEPVIFGRYAQDQANVIGGSDDSNRDMRPTDAAVAAIYGTYYGSDVNLLAAQEEAEQKAIQDAYRAEQERLLLQQQAAEQDRIRRQQEYYAQLQRQEEERARLIREQQERDSFNQQQNQVSAVQCVPTKRRKVTGKKEICVGDRISGVWPGLTPKVIKVNDRSKTVTVMFDYSPQPVDVSIDSIPDAR